jgi:hypothetical protein
MLLRLHDHTHAIAINAKFTNQALQIESEARYIQCFADSWNHVCWVVVYP